MCLLYGHCTYVMCIYVCVCVCMSIYFADLCVCTVYDKYLVQPHFIQATTPGTKSQILQLFDFGANYEYQKTEKQNCTKKQKLLLSTNHLMRCESCQEGIYKKQQTQEKQNKI